MIDVIEGSGVSVGTVVEIVGARVRVVASAVIGGTVVGGEVMGIGRDVVAEGIVVGIVVIASGLGAGEVEGSTAAPRSDTGPDAEVPVSPMK
jgi:hypothetical protein